MEFTINTRPTAEDFLVISIQGRLDAFSISTFERVIESAVPEKHIIVDMEGLIYISSVGIGTLMRCAKRANANKKKFVFCSLKKEVFEIINDTGMAALLQIYPSLEEAQEKLRG